MDLKEAKMIEEKIEEVLDAMQRAAKQGNEEILVLCDLELQEQLSKFSEPVKIKQDLH